MKAINVLQNAKNSPFFKVHFKMRVLAFLMVFFVLISPFYGIKKVKANPVAIGGSAIVALILSGLAAQGLISGEYKVTAAQLTQINDLAQAQLALEGATAVAAAQKLGDALAAGAESAKIKALATGGVIWAFLQSIQDVLWKDIKTDYDKLSPDNSLNGYHFVRSALLSGSNYVYLFQADGVSLDLTEFTFSKASSSTGRLYYNNSASTANTYNSSRVLFKTANMSEGVYPSIYEVELYCNVSKTDESIVKGYTAGAATVSAYFTGLCLGLVNNNSISDISLSSIASSSAITLPTVLSPSVVENINSWDGTSDLVLAPPLPYDVPDDESLVVDPTYGGEVIDPTDPVDPPAEEEGISLPWLSALLALLGLGKLTGIDEGVLSGIDSIVDGITSTIQDVIDGVKTTAGEWATAATAAITTAISGIQSGISSIADTISHVFDPPSKDIDWDKLKSSGSVIFTKFPFSIPADLKFLVGLLVSDPQAPKWTVTVPFSIAGDWAQDGEFELDFSVIDGFMVIVRNIELLAFIFGMVFMTRQLIWK